MTNFPVKSLEHQEQPLSHFPFSQYFSIQHLEETWRANVARKAKQNKNQNRDREEESNKKQNTKHKTPKPKKQSLIITKTVGGGVGGLQTATGAIKHMPKSTIGAG